jgi:hypothetical protein
MDLKKYVDELNKLKKKAVEEKTKEEAVEKKFGRIDLSGMDFGSSNRGRPKKEGEPSLPWSVTHPVHNQLRFYKVDPLKKSGNYDPNYDHGDVKFRTPEELGVEKVVPANPLDKPLPVETPRGPVRAQGRMMRKVYKYRNFKKCGNCGAFDTWQDHSTGKIWCYTCSAVDSQVTKKFADEYDAALLDVSELEGDAEHDALKKIYRAQRKPLECSVCDQEIPYWKHGVVVYPTGAKDESGRAIVVCETCKFREEHPELKPK